MLFKILCTIAFITISIKSQCQAPDKQVLQTTIYDIYKKISDSLKPKRDKYFIIEIKIDSVKKKIKSFAVFQKCETYQSKYVSEIVKRLKKLVWDDLLIYDRILIPVYILPSFDDVFIEDHPFELQSGKQELNGYLRQYTYEMIVIQTFKSVK